MDVGDYGGIEGIQSSSSISFESDEITKLIGNSYYGGNLGWLQENMQIRAMESLESKVSMACQR